MKYRTNILQFGPIMSGFFVMGFVDVVGIASNYIKQDFRLSDTLTNLIVMMVFVWFALLSLPISMLMNKLGRKNTVLISLAIFTTAMLIPIFGYNLPLMLLLFSFIGISNTFLQVSINPLLADIVSSNKFASSITFGQFVKAISSFLGPILAGFAAWYFGNWKLIFPFFAFFSLMTAIWLYFTCIEESPLTVKKNSLKSCLSLLNDRFILGLFFGIIMIVGIDVGLNATIPKYLVLKANLPIEQAGFGSSLYFAAKTTGHFLGAIILIKIPSNKFYFITTVLAIVAMGITMIFQNLTMILISIFIIGLTISNIFPIIFSMALNKNAERKNELSGLMMMGISGGAIIPLIMGLVSDSFGQNAALFVLIVCLIYLLLNSIKIKINAKK